MAEDSLRILQVNTGDTGGGAQNIAWNLFQTYRRRGHRSWLAVGDKHSMDPGVVPITNGALTRAEACFQRGHPRRWGHSVIRRLGHLVEVFQDSYGLENFRYAETWNLLDLVQRLSPPLSQSAAGLLICEPCRPVSGCPRS
jgi:hypothetical protein